jgi:hypothetical protein
LISPSDRRYRLVRVGSGPTWQAESIKRLTGGRYRTGFVGRLVLIGSAAPLVAPIVAAVRGARDAIAVVSLVLLVPADFFCGCSPVA